MTTEIEAQNMSHAFGEFLLLKNINLKILKNEKLVLIGPSGQGKSTLLKILAGVTTPSSGEIFIRGENLLTKRGNENRKKVGMLFQKNALFDSLTVFENVAFPLKETTNLSDKEITERVEHYLNAVGLKNESQSYPEEISGGMQKRLGIARALALEPEIVFYDDPTAGLDPINSRKIVDLILQMQKKYNSTLAVVTNDMNRAFQIADKIAMILDHEIIWLGSATDTKKCKDARVSQFIEGKVSIDGKLHD